VDGSVVIEDLKTIARNLSGERLVITWIPESNTSDFALTSIVKKSILNYQQWLPQHASHHDIDLNCLKEMRTEIYRKANHQLAVESVVLDDRGKEYRSSIEF